MFKIIEAIESFLQKPIRVFWLCVLLVGVSLLFDGSLVKLVRLSRDHLILQKKLGEGLDQIGSLEKQLHEAEKMEFLEHEARDQLNLVKDGDLVFVFSDDSESK